MYTFIKSAGGKPSHPLPAIRFRVLGEVLKLSNIGFDLPQIPIFMAAIFAHREPAHNNVYCVRNPHYLTNGNFSEFNLW